MLDTRGMLVMFKGCETRIILHPSPHDVLGDDDGARGLLHRAPARDRPPGNVEGIINHNNNNDNSKVSISNVYYIIRFVC